MCSPTLSWHIHLHGVRPPRLTSPSSSRARRCSSRASPPPASLPPTFSAPSRGVHLGLRGTSSSPPTSYWGGDGHAAYIETGIVLVWQCWYSVNKQVCRGLVQLRLLVQKISSSKLQDGTAVTKLKIKQKEALGVAEKRGGRRGPGSVIGSSAAGCVCALLSIYNIGGGALAELWILGFVASFCTKLSDTVSSEIGKAYGRTTYLVTTFKVVPRGTEGAVSVEGTLAGIVASMFLAGVGYILGQVNVPQGLVCVLASQIANFGESLIGASLQDKEGFEWLNNDVVNVLNISAGAILAVLMQRLLVSWRS
ncbi:hypothetical protein BRADI_2g48810v3 [Brachypodium distachyon]|uniref:Uncharacterized protein n=1 Tax=Brachypodium distachyon TaxID=15368 RepID=A0A2K2DEP5_BRADI|nr:hypothetical protein BRADI_2g48810v3 [Brachypodium distachyon]PNT72763.1 hypothetical protein BRADI_2g48810v3 [Brachypodium distachyon]